MTRYLTPWSCSGHLTQRRPVLSLFWFLSTFQSAGCEAGLFATFYTSHGRVMNRVPEIMRQNVCWLLVWGETQSALDFAIGSTRGQGPPYHVQQGIGNVTQLMCLLWGSHICTVVNPLWYGTSSFTWFTVCMVAHMSRAWLIPFTMTHWLWHSHCGLYHGSSSATWLMYLYHGLSTCDMTYVSAPWVTCL